MRRFIASLIETKRLPIILIFFVTTVLCVLLVAFRVYYTSNKTFIFLVWNIFLALIPYAITTLLLVFQDRIKNRWFMIIPFVVWLCFFPNAPYILTDLFHLRQREVPYWYDLALILFFAWNGLMLGYASLLDMQAILSARFNKWIGWLASVASLLLSGFGIYLGRYLRWNSWDVISSPEGLFKDIVVRLINPTSHLATYGVTLLFSTFLLLGYVLLVLFSRAYGRMASANGTVIKNTTSI